jgi:hypothetical protein
MDIYISNNTPAGGTSNWLPAGEGNFYLVLRMYQPKAAMLNGTYQVPPIVRIS